MSIYFVQTQSIAALGQSGSDPIVYEPADIDRDVYIKNIGIVTEEPDAPGVVRVGFQGTGENPWLRLAPHRTDGGLGLQDYDRDVRFVLPANYPLEVARATQPAVEYQIAVTPVV